MGRTFRWYIEISLLFGWYIGNDSGIIVLFRIVHGRKRIPTNLEDISVIFMMLFRSLIVSLLDKSEKIIPTVTPANLKDDYPLMHPLQL